MDQSKRHFGEGGQVLWYISKEDLKEFADRVGIRERANTTQGAFYWSKNWKYRSGICWDGEEFRESQFDEVHWDQFWTSRFIKQADCLSNWFKT